MTTAKVRSGSRIKVATSRATTTSFRVAAGTAVVMASTLSTVGNNSGRGSNWLPPVRQPIGYADVMMPDGTKQNVQVMVDQQWFLGFNEAFNRRLAGVQGPTITDASTNATNAIQAVTANAQAISAVQQQSDAAAAAATASKQVLVDNDVPGADQIPDVLSQKRRNF